MILEQFVPSVSVLSFGHRLKFKMLYDPSESELKEELHAAFKLFDKDGKGVVHTVDLKSILYSLGIKMSTHQIQALVAREGKHDHKTLTLPEFSAIVRSLVRCRKLVHNYDEVRPMKVADAYNVFALRAAVPNF